MEQENHNQVRYTEEDFSYQTQRRKERLKQIQKLKKKREQTLQRKIANFKVVLMGIVIAILLNQNYGRNITRIEELTIDYLDETDDLKKHGKILKMIYEALYEYVALYDRMDLENFYTTIVTENYETITAQDIDTILGIIKNYTDYYDLDDYPLFKIFVTNYKDDPFTTCGKTSIAILEDILDEDIIWEIALGKENEILEKAVTKINARNSQIEISVEGLKERLIEIEAHEDIFKTDVFSSAMPYDKPLQAEILKYFSDQESCSFKIYPWWNRQANDETGYPVYVSNNYVNKIICNLPQIESRNNFNLEDYVNKILNQRGKELLDDLITQTTSSEVELSGSDSKNEAILLLAMLNPEITLVQYGETIDDYLTRIEEYYQGRLNIYQFALALEQENTAIAKEYYKVFFDELSKRDIAVEDVYKYNLTNIYFSEVELSSIFDDGNFYEIETEANLTMKNLLQAQKKEHLIPLLDIWSATYESFDYKTGEKVLSNELYFYSSKIYDQFKVFDVPKGITEIQFFYPDYENDRRIEIPKEEIKMININEDIDRYFVKFENEETSHRIYGIVSLENFLNRSENQVLSRKK